MKTIILTGPKHSGKTSAGKVLALLCSCDFFDIDELILQRTGKSPRQLFIEGPEVFQKAEAEAAADLLNANGADKNCADRNCVDRSGASGEEWRVIAAGGGIIDNTQASIILKKSGAAAVYLNISAETAWGRISASGELPPFLQTDNPRETHRVLHERRAEAYLQFADIVIEAEAKTPQQIAEEILAYFS